MMEAPRVAKSPIVATKKLARSTAVSTWFSDWAITSVSPASGMTRTCIRKPREFSWVPGTLYDSP